MPVNNPAVGDHPWLGGPTVEMLSAIGGPPGPSMAAVHGPGEHPWLPHLVRGDHWQCDITQKLSENP